MSLYWNDNPPSEPYRVPDEVQDLSFRIECRVLPADHADALHLALAGRLPWMLDSPGVGVHLIHGAESGNGWQRPEAPDALLHLPRRARLVLRLPEQRLEDARRLCGQTLDLAGYPVVVGEATPRPLSDITTLFARYVLAEVDAPACEESEFLRWAQQALGQLGVGAEKMLAGRSHHLLVAGRDQETRSLLLAGLDVEASVRLQQHGLGAGRLYGCGLFLPHKSIEPVAARKG